MTQLASIIVGRRCVQTRHALVCSHRRCSPHTNSSSAQVKTPRRLQEQRRLSLRFGWLLQRRLVTCTAQSKSHSSPHPPQTLAAQFKRPYRNCPDHTNLGIPAFLIRGSPDRALTSCVSYRDRFIGRVPKWSLRSRLASSANPERRHESQLYAARCRTTTTTALCENRSWPTPSRRIGAQALSLPRVSTHPPDCSARRPNPDTRAD